jgi:ADP-ribose pyrophosphatase
MMAIRCIKKEYLVDSEWLRGRKDSLVINDSNETDFYVVEKKDVALVLAINEHNEILLVDEYKYPVNLVMTGLPGGTFDRGCEQPLDAAQRELKEETGCESDEWELFFKTYEYPTKDIHEIYFYIAKNCVQTSEQNLDENEELTFRWVPLKDAYNMVISNEIEHGCTAYALLRYATIKMRWE